VRQFHLEGSPKQKSVSAAAAEPEETVWEIPQDEIDALLADVAAMGLDITPSEDEMLYENDDETEDELGSPVSDSSNESSSSESDSDESSSDDSEESADEQEDHKKRKKMAKYKEPKS
jgi:hypothetical protein